MNRLQRNAWLLAAIIFAVGVTIFTLSHIVTEPWGILPDIGGDGSKNNFTYLYHSMYGHGYWFDGMNYPYGEHITYTDGIPLLSVFLTQFKHITSGDALTLLWWLLGFSYVLAIVYVYKILAHFKVAPFVAIIFAGLIVVCSPQLFCIKGHYALAFNCVAPMLFYWTILYHEHARMKYCLYIFITGSTMAFLHPYYLALMLVWTMSYGVGYIILIKGSLTGKLKKALPPLVFAGLVFVLVAAVMKATDPIKDRPASPYYERGMYTQLSHIFSSSWSPLWKLAISMKIVPKASKGGEGFTYLGVVAAAVIVLSLAYFVWRKVRKEQMDFEAETGGFAPIWLFMAFLVLALSMGIPFIWKMEWLFDYFSVLKQFRTLGRFSWIFYNVISIYAVVVLYAWYTRFIKKHRPAYGHALLTICIAIWGYEASGCTAFSRQLSLEAKYNYGFIFTTFEDQKGWVPFLNEHKADKNDFQGILLLPFFHIGTEKLWVGDPGWLVTIGTQASLQLQLPIVDVMLSRSSWSAAEKQVRLAGGPFTNKPILKDIKSNKPFLLLDIGTNGTYYDQQYLLAAADYLGTNQGVKVYALYPDRVAANDKKMADSINSILPQLPAGDTCIGDKGSLYMEHFDATTTTDRIGGTGAKLPVYDPSSTFRTIPVKPVLDSALYEFSCWFLLGDKDPRSPYFTLEQLDNTGKVIASCDALTKMATDNNGMWFRAGCYFYMKQGCVSLRCVLVNDPNPSYKLMDELLLRPATTLVISKAKDGSVMVNNHKFPVK